MKNILYKEFRLALHPTAVIFLFFAAMMLIPNYPYCTNFFYCCLGMFFVCLTGRENHDIFYSMTLPIKKKDIVKARMIFVVLFQMVQTALTIPVALLRNCYPVEILKNEAGLDTNLALYGEAFLLFGLFNFIFFTSYYKNVNGVGKAFVKATLTFFIVMLVVEATTFAVPFVRDYIDNTDPAYMLYRLPILIVGVIAYVVLTLLAYKKSVKSFCALDL